MDAIERRLGLLSHDELVRVLAARCAESTATQRATEVAIIALRPTPSWVTDLLSSSGNVLPLILSWCSLRDGTTAAVCSAWRDEWAQRITFAWWNLKDAGWRGDNDVVAIDKLLSTSMQHCSCGSTSFVKIANFSETMQFLCANCEKSVEGPCEAWRCTRCSLHGGGLHCSSCCTSKILEDIKVKGGAYTGVTHIFTLKDESGNVLGVGCVDKSGGNVGFLSMSCPNFEAAMLARAVRKVLDTFSRRTPKMRIEVREDDVARQRIVEALRVRGYRFVRRPGDDMKEQELLAYALVLA